MTAIHGHGLPAWVELPADDPAAAVAFYSDLFGRTSDESPGETPYTVMSNQGRRVGGIMGKMNPGQPVQWLTYFQADDLEATIAAVRDAGGRVYMDPMDMPGGRFTFASDAVDAPLGLVTAGNAFEAFGDPGDLVWFELQSHKPAAPAAAFYERVFGWTLSTEIDNDEMTYLTFTGAGQEAPSGGVFNAPEMPDYLGGYSQWTAAFAVADVPATVARAEALGATTHTQQMDTPYGDFAAFRDPQGALLVVMRPAPNPSAG